MKKNYIAPATQVMTIGTAQMVCTSPGSMTISNTQTSTQWSREFDIDDEDNE